MSNPMYNIEILVDTLGEFLSDRWGTDEGVNSSTYEWYKKTGHSKEQCAQILETHQHVFNQEACFLFGKNASGSQEAEIGFWVEFELDDDLIPEFYTDNPTPEEQKAWHQGFEIFAPAFVHVAHGLEKLRAKDEPLMQCYYYSEAPNGGAISVFIPLSCTHHYEAVYKLLFENGLPFPPSSHARIEALSKINFIRRNKHFPACLLPKGAALAA
jgi:hypothetical protein